MAITIQELLASDTISQVVDKINFNFDQLLLNGGGPVGPAGPLGPPGPIGGRGERGTEWYEGTADPNVVPPTLTPLTADYYLQGNGDVWEFTGLTWTNTGINLVGPAGPSGASVGWSQFGNNPYPNYAATYQNVLYPAPITTGITVSNQGVAATLIGAVGPGDVSANPGIPFTPAFQLNNTMAGSIDASVVSMLVHQKDSSASAIKFMGGGAVAADNYEQSSIGELSSIGLGTDDSIVINVPKAVTGVIGSLQDTYGFNLYTLKKGQSFRAGRSISFTTGTLGATLSGPLDVSDFIIDLNVVNSTQLPKYEMNILGSKDASISAGNVTLPVTTTKEGNIVLDSGNINLIARGLIKLESLTGEWNFPGLQSVSITPIGLVGVSASGKLGTLSAGGTLTAGILGWNGTTLTSDTGVDNRLVRWDGTSGIQSSVWQLSDGGTLYPVGGGGILGDASLGTVGGIVMGSDKRIIFNDSLGFIDPDGSGSNDESPARFVKRSTSQRAQLQLGLSPVSATPISSTSNIGNTQLYFGSQYISNFGVYDTREFPKIEFAGNPSSSNAIALTQNAYGTNPPGVYMKSGLPGASPWTSNILKIKGSNGGSTTSSGANVGKGVQISGGDGGSSNGAGGSVIISPGGTTDLNQTAGQYIWLGYNPHYDIGSDTGVNRDVRRSASHIAIGPTQGSVTSTAWGASTLNDSRGFVFIQQPPTEKYGSTEDEYVLRLQNNRSAAGSNGGFMIGTKDNEHALNIYPNLTGGAYWARTQSGDTGIFLRNNGNTGTGTGGLAIALKDKDDLGIRLDPSGGPENTEQIFFYGNVDENPEDFDELAFRFKGRQSILNVYGARTTGRYEEVFASGTMYPFATAGNLAGAGAVAGYLMWQRIGQVVHVTGQVNFGPGTGQRIILLPVKGNNGTSNVTGTGTGWGTSNVPLEIHAAGTNGFSAKSNGSWFGASGGNIRVSFSYMML